jgi:hypothetical protein
VLKPGQETEQFGVAQYESQTHVPDKESHCPCPEHEVVAVLPGQKSEQFAPE